MAETTWTTKAGMLGPDGAESVIINSEVAVEAAAAASASETAAAASASAASSSASAASVSAAAAATVYDDFDDRYLGAKASAPATDNDGDPLQAGALYFNTTDTASYVYTGSTWDVVASDTTATNAAASAAAALVSENNAAASESAAATSESNAATSETNAATSETNAATSETNAAASAAAALVSETNAAASAVEAANIAAGELFDDTQTSATLGWTSSKITTELAAAGTKGTLTTSSVAGQTSTINLTSAVSTPTVGVTKEIPQTGVTTDKWNLGAGFTPEDFAYNATLSFGATAYDLSVASYDNKSFSVSAQDTNPSGLAFSTEGTKMFVVGGLGADVNEYTLSTAWDVSTASFVDSFSVSGQTTSPRGLTFNGDGTKMYVIQESTDQIAEYALSTAWDVSTASYTDSLSVTSQESTPAGIVFNDDGTKFFVIGTGGVEVNEYTLSTAYDVSTASHVDAFSVSAQEGNPKTLAFNADGTKMFILGLTNDSVYQYSLSTGFDVSTASYDSVSYDVSSQETDPYDMAFSTDGDKLYIIGRSVDSVLQYSTSTGTLTLSTGSFASTDVGKLIYANDGEFVLTASTGTYVEIVAPSATTDVTSGNWQMYGLDTSDGVSVISTVEGGFDISTASYASKSFSVSAQESLPMGVALSADGTKMFVTGEDGNDINEYTLSTAWDVSTASFVDSFNVGSQDINPRGIAFNTDGTKVFICGDSGDTIEQYTLSTAYDISTAAYGGTLAVNAQTNEHSGVGFNTDGTKMFVASTSGSQILEYSLSTAFDITTASYIDALSVSSQETHPRDMAFNTDGTEMFVIGSTSEAVFKYTLSTGFDISTASYSNVSFSVSSQDTEPFGMFFKPDGTIMYMVGITNDTVYQYDVGTVYAPTNQNLVALTNTAGNIDTTYWTDINNMTATDDDAGESIYYAVSTDDQTTWYIVKTGEGVRTIARNNLGTWEYNSNTTYGAETWVAATQNDEYGAIKQAIDVAANLMTSTQLGAAADAEYFTLGDDLDLAIIMNTSAATSSPSFTGLEIDYDAAILNEGAILGTDYDFDHPEGDVVRFTALQAGNYKLRIV